MNSGPFEDRLELRELIENFANSAMRIDPDAWGANWAEEGYWKLPSMPEAAEGKANIVAAFEKAMAYVNFFSMICTPSDLNIEGDTATGKAYCREQIYTKTGGQVYVVGCYHDEFVKRDGRWLFLKRVYEVIGKDINT